MEAYQRLLEKIDAVVCDMADKILSEGIAVVKPGNNGPYYNIETKVRNQAHWAIVFSKYYKSSGDEKYKKLVIMLADDILSSEFYNQKGVYKCREVKKGDEVNGVIGAAWIIEGLINACMITNDRRYYDRAVEMFLAVPFNERLGIWNRRNTKNEKLSVDATFNHQLWFAASGAMINHCIKNDEIKSMLKVFIKKLPGNMTVRKNGRIGHFTMNDQNGFLGYFGRIYRDISNDFKEAFKKPSLAYKETGYHAFNLYGFAILKEYYDEDIAFLSSRRFRKCLSFAAEQRYYDMLTYADKKMDETNVGSRIENGFNVFSFAYNSPAFELKNVYDTFKMNDEKSRALLDLFCGKMLELSYDDEKLLFCRNTDDPVTLTARIYEMLPFVKN